MVAFLSSGLSSEPDLLLVETSDPLLSTHLALGCRPALGRLCLKLSPSTRSHAIHRYVVDYACEKNYGVSFVWGRKFITHCHTTACSGRRQCIVYNYMFSQFKVAPHSFSPVWLEQCDCHDPHIHKQLVNFQFDITDEVTCDNRWRHNNFFSYSYFLVLK